MTTPAILRRSMPLTALVTVLASLAGCSPEVAEGDADPGDLPAWGDSVALVEEVRIGSLDGDEPYMFAYVAGVAPASDGTVFVADMQNFVVRRYARDGTFLHEFGRAGEGPGEFGYISAIQMDAEGRVVVLDQSRRVHTFEPDGAFVSTRIVDGMMGGWGRFALGSTGEIYSAFMAPQDGPLIDESQLQMYYARVDESGQPERLAAMPAEDPEGPRYVLSGRGGYYRPMVTMNLSTVGPDGAVYWVRNDEYRIRRLSADGDTTELVREEPRIELTDDELREWNARSESMAERSPEMRDQFFPIPTVKPYIRDLAVDADGRLWVSRYTNAVYVPYTPEEAADREEQGLPNYNWRDTLTWDVWSPDGSFLGTVTLPHKTSFSTASGNEVWGVQQGSFREDYVVRWRLEFGN